MLLAFMYDLCHNSFFYYCLLHNIFFMINTLPTTFAQFIRHQNPSLKLIQ